ncbi:hypothetical protein ABW19_dt0203872 [Dactylella cylindrospora]|nr:hypothetical protein ABW19_dt0203872 [Dactylella cylindrospora]
MAKLFLTETISANKIGGIGALKTHILEFEKAGGERWEMANLTAKATSEFSKSSKKESFEAEFMRDLYCKLLVNSFTVTTQSFDPIGIAIDYKAAMLNHSCNPNAAMLFDGRTLLVRSLKEIQKDTEITISYIDNFMTRKERRAELSSRYFFDCDCAACSSESQKLEASLCHECKKMVPSASSACPACNEPVSEELDPAIALAASTSAAREGRNADKSVPTLLKSLKSLYATKLLPPTYHPIPQLHQDLAMAYIDASDWKSAFLHLLTLYVKFFPAIYETPYHPVRVVRTFTLAMVLIQVAVVAPGGFGVDLDYTKLLYGLLVEVTGNVDKSHGEGSTFAGVVKRKMEEVKVDVGIDSNREAEKWMGKGLRGVPGLEGEVGKIVKIVDGFLEELAG